MKEALPFPGRGTAPCALGETAQCLPGTAVRAARGQSGVKAGPPSPPRRVPRRRVEEAGDFGSQLWFFRSKIVLPSTEARALKVELRPLPLPLDARR